MFSNKLDVGIVYVFKVGIMRINLKILLIRSNIIFFKFSIPIFLASFLLFTFILEFALIFPIFSPTRIAKLRKFETKNMLVGGRGTT